MISSKLDNYRTLLLIRRKARRRDLFVTGGVFLVSFSAMIALGLLDSLNGRSLYIVSAMVVAFGFSFLMTWVKLEVLKGLIETLENFQD